RIEAGQVDPARVDDHVVVALDGDVEPGQLREADVPLELDRGPVQVDAGQVEVGPGDRDVLPAAQAEPAAEQARGGQLAVGGPGERDALPGDDSGDVPAAGEVAGRVAVEERHPAAELEEGDEGVARQ